MLLLFNISCAAFKSGFDAGKLKRQLRLDPNNYAIHYKLGVNRLTFAQDLGNSYFKEKELLIAINSFKEAIRTKPDYSEAHLMLGEGFAEGPINDGFSAIKHTIIAMKLAERQNDVKVAARAKEKLRILQKSKYKNSKYCFYRKEKRVGVSFDLKENKREW